MRWLLDRFFCIGLLRLHFGGDSSSSNATTTTNVDKRQVVDAGGIGVSSDQSTVTVQTLDAGIVQKALDTITAADAIGGKSLDSIVALASSIFSGGLDVLKAGQAQTGTVLATAVDRKTDTGTLDQKTIVTLGLAAAGVTAVALYKRKAA